MISVGINRLKSGMVLAKPVHSLHGVLLLDKGDELTEKNIWMLKSWGVSQIWLEGGHEEKKDLQPENKIKPSIREELREKFSGVLEDHVMAEIMRAAGEQLEKRLLKNEK